MFETGLVAGTEDNQEMEDHFQGGNAGDGELLRTAHPLPASNSGRPALEVKLLPITPSMILDGAALEFPGTPFQLQAPAPKLPSSPNTPAWCTSWAQLPSQQEVLLPPEAIRAKLHQICNKFLHA